ncbi:uncharacterized protein LOC116295869 [Actinia tenebrosa]|uniref:Uncharacterized protein LOC116295869 n=1 Tax=Actinia tenebrosa TaxID=6105 RepID=A0A6P8HTG0_ACTTE|nr:uncharacterized protein LOC116295869 [Actinia tenebrosa]
MCMAEYSCMQWLAVNPLSFWLPISAMASPNAEKENCSTSPCNVPRVESDVTGSLRNNGTFKWTEERDRLLLRQIVSLEPFAYKAGTKEAGLRWTEVAEINLEINAV